ncbi:MAG: hypothetical protein BWK78_06240 [Thiotrichaceae bacterium IS1]|nr:MAG: hypothetical protein BWK78_06240 [Thiotrichaceae bacterium IS1]
MPTLTLDLPDNLCQPYPTLEQLRQTVYEDFIAHEFQKGNVSLGQGAELLGLTYEQFMLDFLGSRQISFINGTPEELATEIQQEQTWLENRLQMEHRT